MTEAKPLPPPASLGWPMLAVIGVTALGAVGARVLGRTPLEQSAAWLGVAVSAAAGSLGLILKRRALTRGIRRALAMTGATFLLRLLLLLWGAVWVRSHGGAVTAFIVGFLVVFGALQWVEFGYLATATRGRT